MLSSPTAKRTKLNDFNKFNIPLALLTNPRSSNQLAHYVFEFLDMFDVLFGINMLEHATHGNIVLLNGQWWNRRLTNELGSHVTRCSDDVLQHWQQQWPNQLSPASDAAQKLVISQALWFNAAVHLATRLRTFAREILGQTDGPIRMPAAMRYVLTVAPPFQLCSQYLMPWHPLCSRLAQRSQWGDSEPIEDADPAYFWFATTEEAAEGTQFIALYTGPTYVISDANTNTLGDVVDDEEQQQDDDEGASATRVVHFTNPDLWPVVEWEAYQSRCSPASNLHQYTIKRGVYLYCDKLHAMWDERATFAFQPDKPLRNEDDVNRENHDKCDKRDASLHPSFAPPFAIRFSEDYMVGLFEEQFGDVTNFMGMFRLCDM